MEHFYDRKLIRAYRNLLEVRDREESLVDRRNEEARRINAKVNAQVDTLRAEADAATKTDRNALVALDLPLAAAPGVAAEKTAHTGGVYDPQNPSATSVLRDEKRPIEAVLADLRLPWTPGDGKIKAAAWLSWLLSGLTGVFIGISVGIIAGFLAPDNFQGNPAILLLCAEIGLAPAFLGKIGLRAVAAFASERHYLGQKAADWLIWACIAVLFVGGVIVASDSIVEQHGLLTNYRLKAMIAGLSGASAARTGGHEITFLLAAILILFPYVVANLVDGIYVGRHHACLNRGLSTQLQEYAAADAARRAAPVPQDTLYAIARVQDIVRRQSALTTRTAETAAPFERRIAETEASRLPLSDEPDDEAKRRIQDAVDNFNGAQAEFDRMLDEARLLCGGYGPWWRRLWRTLFGYRPPRRRAHDEKRRL